MKAALKDPIWLSVSLFGATRSPDGASALPQETDLYDPRTQWASYLINALKAKELQKRNVNYIVRGEEVTALPSMLPAADVHCRAAHHEDI